MPNLTKSGLVQIIKQASKLTVEEFCNRWIPLLYGIHPDDRLFSRACMQEIVRISEGKVKRKSIVKNWILFGDNPLYPAYMEPILNLANTKYKVLEALEALPRYTLDIETDEEQVP